MAHIDDVVNVIPLTGLNLSMTPSSKALASFGNVARSTAPADAMSQDSVFMLDNTFYRSRHLKSNHWSIVWSDLMMTMFILFIALYAYQLTQKGHNDYLSGKTPEVLGGTTTQALDLPTDRNGAFLPFVPITQGAPLVTAGTIRKVETVPRKALIPVEKGMNSLADTEESALKKDSQLVAGTGMSENTSSFTSATNNTTSASPERSQEKTTPLDVMYDLSQQVLTENNLKKFASINLIPDNTMRIILTGDLLFEPGKADLTKNARQSLLKVTAAIKNSPYMINVVGHTDNVPIKSKLYSSNWELSVARASRVVRFLIEENGMNSSQFEVSGYASFRQVKPNTTEENKALNRRVEIIISKKLPPAEPIISDNVPII